MVDIYDDVSDLQELADAQLRARERSRRLLSHVAILKAYAIMGVCVTVAALAFFGFTLIKDKLTNEQQMTLAVAAAGAGISALSYLTLNVYKHMAEVRAQAVESILFDHDLVRGWAQFEDVGRRILEAKGVEFNTRSPRAILLALASNELLPGELAQELRSALDVRNRVVHQKDAVSRPLVEAATKTVAQANTMLETKLSNLAVVPSI
jgi:hypothetical protein